MSLLGWIRHLFIPHQSNNHRARILHPSVLAVIVAGFLVYQFGLNFYLLVRPSVLGFASSISPERVIEATNQKRGEKGLAPLTINSKLNEAAQRKAGDMFAFDYWAHTSPSGRNPWAFFQEVGYKYLYAGENLARDFQDSGAVVEAWMNSPTHRDNLLNPNYKEIGLAVVNGTLNGVETTLVVQLFGTPTPAVAKAPQPQVPAFQPAQAPQAAPELGEASVVLTQAEETAQAPTISPFLLTKMIVIFLLGLILGALFLDALLVYRQRIVRLSGKNLAHLIFVGAVLLSAILTTPGAIL